MLKEQIKVVDNFNVRSFDENCLLSEVATEWNDEAVNRLFAQYIEKVWWPLFFFPELVQKGKEQP